MADLLYPHFTDKQTAAQRSNALDQGWYKGEKLIACFVWPGGTWDLSSPIRIKLVPLHRNHGVLTTGPPGNSLEMDFKLSYLQLTPRDFTRTQTASRLSDAISQQKKKRREKSPERGKHGSQL